jgi:5'-nucleotidase
MRADKVVALSLFTTNKTLVVPSEYGLIPAGARSIGTDPNDSNIW